MITRSSLKSVINVFSKYDYSRLPNFWTSQMKINCFFILGLLVFLPSLSANEFLTKDITVYKNPECSCCTKWVKYLKTHQYNVTVISTRKLLSEKARLKIPPELAACHTAEIGGYVVEGHVTHRDITRLLLFQPEVLGIAVPGMPIGTPGMERGDTVVPYNVMSFDSKGDITVFVKH